MPKRPGGELASRPLHFIWIADCSGSMSLDGKMDALNASINACIPEMRRAAFDNPNADVLVRAIRFSHGASWQIASPTPLSDFSWTDLKADALQQAAVDIVFAIDTTGSMSPYITGLTNTCVKFADIIDSRHIRTRLGLIGFGDLTIGEHMTVHALTSDTNEFRHLVRALPRTGGGDAPESSLDAIREALRFNFGDTNQKVIIAITDAPPHDPDHSGSRWTDVLRMACDAGAIVYCIAPSIECWRRIPEQTGGQWFQIAAGADFTSIVDRLGEAVAMEISRRLDAGTLSHGTDLGAALRLVADELKIPPMSERALPPVLVLVSDGRPTDDFRSGLSALLSQQWGIKAVRIAIGLGKDADVTVLREFMGNSEIEPLLADAPESLAHYIKWASTAVIKAASTPVVGVSSSASMPEPRVANSVRRTVW